MARTTTAQELELGRAARARLGRREHAGWHPTAGRFDPVELLIEQDASRSPGLVPVRHGRMAMSAFSFYRGAAAVMAADLAASPNTGLTVQLCGDAHLSNFGAFASPERHLVFDLNDFDETLPGPFEWDVKRLATSLVIAARDTGMSAEHATDIAMACVGQYRDAMVGFARLGVLDTWYAHLDVEEMRAELQQRGSKKASQLTALRIAQARRRTSAQAVEKLTEMRDGHPRIRLDPPLVVPLSALAEQVDPAALGEEVRTFFDTYQATISASHRHVLSQYEIIDMAHKVVGVGSVGTRALIVLLRGRHPSDHLMLQFKEAGASVLERHLGSSKYGEGGERVVEGQRLMQASSDIFLGWATSPSDGRSYYWRQLRDMKGSAEIATMTPKGLLAYGRICGWTLARAHARSGSPIAISAYLGSKPTFDRAIASFASAYADQNERDWCAHQGAIASGRILALPGV